MKTGAMSNYPDIDLFVWGLNKALRTPKYTINATCWNSFNFAKVSERKIDFGTTNYKFHRLDFCYHFILLIY